MELYASAHSLLQGCFPISKCAEKEFPQSEAGNKIFRVLRLLFLPSWANFICI